MKQVANVRPFDPPIVERRESAAFEDAPVSAGISWIVPIVTVLFVLVLAPIAAIGWYQYEHQDKIFRGVSALGVDLSGMTADEARTALDARARALTERPVLVRAGDNQWRTDWGRLGLRLPTEPVVAEALAVGREGNPF